LGSEGIITGLQSNVYANDFGKQGDWWYNENISTFHHNLFAQVVYLLPYSIQLTTGLSYNRQYFFYKIQSLSAPERQFTLYPAVPWTPRVSILKKIGGRFSTYLSYSRGFSTPTNQEIANTFQYHPEKIGLKSEKGNTIEGGILYNSNDNRWEAGLVFYRTNVLDGIVRYVNADGTEFNVNSGKQNLLGLESTIKSNLITQNTKKWVNKLDIQSSFAWQRFTYLDYNPLGKDFSGNKIPGSPDLIFGSQFDLYLLRYLSLSAQINYHGNIFLDDANLIKDQDYVNINTRLAYNFKIGMHQISIYCMGQNILNQPINTGNDLNALGGRFYNPGMPFHVQAGIRRTN
jgi:iron complex outermembrane receptor protein